MGSKADYEREFGETPFGLLIRRIAKLDHDAAMAAFSEFINDQSLNQQQIAFVHKVINHVEQNGYMEDMSELLKPPFDKPLSFMKLFDARRQKAIMQTLAQIKNNAIHVVAWTQSSAAVISSEDLYLSLFLTWKLCSKG